MTTPSLAAVLMFQKLAQAPDRRVTTVDPKPFPTIVYTIKKPFTPHGSDTVVGNGDRHPGGLTAGSDGVQHRVGRKTGKKGPPMNAPRAPGADLHAHAFKGHRKAKHHVQAPKARPEVDAKHLSAYLQRPAMSTRKKVGIGAGVLGAAALTAALAKALHTRAKRRQQQRVDDLRATIAARPPTS